MYKKNIINNLIFLMVFVIISSFIFISRASDDTKLSLLEGLNLIDKETMNLRDMRDIRFEKLKSDLDDFINKDYKDIGKGSVFYLLNETNFSTEELGWGLDNTNLKGLEKDFREVSLEVGINPILLMAMAKHETGNGTSELFRDKKNLFGFNAVDHDPYNMATNFSSYRDSIETIARFLKNEYLDEKGRYFNGISTSGIGKSYASDPDWSKKVDGMMVEVAYQMINGYENYK